CPPLQRDMAIMDAPVIRSSGQAPVALKEGTVPVSVKAKRWRKSAPEKTSGGRVAKDVAPPTRKAKFQWMNSRLAHYKQLVGEPGTPGEKEMIDKVKAFL